MKLGFLVEYQGRRYTVVGHCTKLPAEPIKNQRGTELYDLEDCLTGERTKYVEASAVNEVTTPLVVA